MVQYDPKIEPILRILRKETDKDEAAQIIGRLLQGYDTLRYTDGLLTGSEGRDLLYVDPELLTGEYVMPDTVEHLIGHPFHYCAATQITLSANLRHLSSGEFEGCRSLKRIIAPGKLHSIDRHAFHYIDLESQQDGSILIGNVLVKGPDAPRNEESADTYHVPESVTILADHCFANTPYRTIVCHDGVTSIQEGAFYKNTVVENIRLPEGLSVIEEETFWHCGSLRHIRIPDSVTEIGKNAFAYCENLEEVILPKSLKRIDSGAFCYCRKLTDLALPEDLQAIGTDAFFHCPIPHMTIPASVTDLNDVYPPSLTLLCSNAPYQICRKGKTLYLGENFRGFVGGYGMICSTFIYDGITVELDPCNSFLTYENGLLRDKQSGKVNLCLSDQFRITYREKEYTVSDFRCKLLIDFDTALSALQSDEPYFFIGAFYKKRYCAIGSQIFSEDRETYYGSFLGEPLDLFSVPGLTTIDHDAYIAWDSLILPDSVTNITHKTPRIPLHMERFHIGKNLELNDFVMETIYRSKSVRIPPDYYDLVTIDGAIYQKETDGLKLVWFPRNHVGDVNLPGNVASIGKCAFYQCREITKVYLPDCVKAIEEKAFEDCTALTDIICAGGSPVIDPSAWEKCTALMEHYQDADAVYCGHTLVKYKGSAMEFVVPDYVTVINPHAFSSRTMKKITVGENVHFVGDHAFAYAEILEVHFGQTEVDLMPDLFFRSKGLGKVTMPRGCRFDERIGQFYQKKALDYSFLGPSLKEIDEWEQSSLSVYVTQEDYRIAKEKNELRYSFNWSEGILDGCRRWSVTVDLYPRED